MPIIGDVSWRPLITDRAPIDRLLRELVDALDANHARYPCDHADRALLRTYLMQDDTVDDPDGQGSQALATAVNMAPEAGPALIGGMVGIGWTVAHLAEGEIADRVCGAIEAALARRLPDDYDLVRGVVGVGVYALERGRDDLIGAVLDRLESTAVPRLGGLAWHTPVAWLPPWQQETAPGGYWNLGLAHGMPGAIALLARLCARGVDRARPLLDGAMTHMLAVEPASSTGRYPSWHFTDGTRDHEPNGRIAWCYGDLGVATAFYAASVVDPKWRDDAMTLALDCAARERTANDTGICHGAFGNAHMFNRLWQVTDDDRFAAAARRWLAQGLAMRSDHPIAGFPSLEQGEIWKADPSMLTGVVGAGLVLHAAVSEISPDWDRLLLLDLDACPAP